MFKSPAGFRYKYQTLLKGDNKTVVQEGKDAPLPPAATTKSPKTKKKKKTVEQSVTATTAVTDGVTEESKYF